VQSSSFKENISFKNKIFFITLDFVELDMQSNREIKEKGTIFCSFYLFFCTFLANLAAIDI
jgi:hypothetical protein